jgi:hypothetical protein
MLFTKLQQTRLLFFLNNDTQASPTFRIANRFHNPAFPSSNGLSLPTFLASVYKPLQF